MPLLAVVLEPLELVQLQGAPQGTLTLVLLLLKPLRPPLGPLEQVWPQGALAVAGPGVGYLDAQ